MGTANGDLRLAELMAGLSLAADLGLGQPLEHTLRTCLRSVAIGRDLGLKGSRLRDLYYVSLLRFIGCTATSETDVREAAGDEIQQMAALAPVFNGTTAEMLPVFVRSIGVGLPPWRRAGPIARAMADPGSAQRTLSTHCEVASRLAHRLGMGPRVEAALAHAYERWDGKGFPSQLAGEDVPVEVRIVTVARDAELWAGGADPAAVAEVLRSRRGRAYDPDVVDVVLGAGPIRPGDGAGATAWERVLDAEPAPVQHVDRNRLDDALLAFADFTDLKAPDTRGHSREVAELAAAAANSAGHDQETATLVRHAGLVHDLGRVAIPLSVWGQPGPLSRADQERVRLHPYYTERILAPCQALEQVVDVAARHHERVDGTGYHRACGPADQPPAARLLAAADAYQAMTQARAHRPARSPDEAAGELRADVDDGRLDPAAVEAVLDAAGHPRRRVPVEWPAGLTDREVEVLRLSARGRTNKQVAAALVIAPKTVGHHLEHVYRKIGVSTRGAAALFAVENDLI